MFEVYINLRQSNQIIKISYDSTTFFHVFELFSLIKLDYIHNIRINLYYWI